MSEWRPIDTAPRDTYKVAGPTLILGHAENKWIRFGRWHVQERAWYYSGTNERSQRSWRWTGYQWKIVERTGSSQTVYSELR